MTHRYRKDNEDENRFNEDFLNLGGDEAGVPETPVPSSPSAEAAEADDELDLPSARTHGRDRGGEAFMRLRDEESYGESEG